MIEQIILLILLISFVINILNIVALIWYNDYFNKNYDNCFISNNKSLYELETYRSKLADFLYNPDNNSFKNIKNNFITTYYIILTLLIILIILSIKYSYNNNNNIIFTIFKILCLIIYYKIANIVINKLNKIETLKYDKNEDIYRYNLAFKILNSLLYLDKNDNIFKEIFDYSSSYVKNEKTFEERLSINIGDIHNTNNKIEIEYIKSKLINNLTYLNYINLNEVSPFYFKKYFNNIYIIIDNKIFYIKDIINNDIINKLVKDKLLKSGETEENIDGINYIKFLNDNKNLIFKLKHMKGKIIDNIELHYDLIYNIIVFLLILLTFLHSIYHKTSSNIYVVILLILIIILGIYLGTKLNNL